MEKEKACLDTQLSTRWRSMELKTILKELIKKRGITITALSRATKVPLQTLHGWLQGSEPRSLKQVKSVADFFNVDLDYLCFGIEGEKNKNNITEFEDEINAGIFEVVLRRVRTKK